MKRAFHIWVEGKSGDLYAFSFSGNPAHLAEWRAQGFCITEVANTVPGWAAAMGLARPWCAVQDAWQWLRVW